MKPPVCPYCGENASFYYSSQAFYNGRDFGPCWGCVPCQALVGVHKGTQHPLGRLKNRDLRQAYRKAVSLFKRIWIEGHASRSFARTWLSNALEIPEDKCDIGWFDLNTCNKVVFLCESLLGEFKQRVAAVRGARQRTLPEVW